MKFRSCKKDESLQPKNPVELRGGPKKKSKSTEKLLESKLHLLSHADELDNNPDEKRDSEELMQVEQNLF
jgi:hypothetical protein